MATSSGQLGELMASSPKRVPGSPMLGPIDELLDRINVCVCVCVCVCERMRRGRKAPSFLLLIS